MLTKSLKKTTAFLGLSSILLSGFILTTTPVHAGGVSTTISPSTVAVSTAGTTTIAYTSTVSVPTTGNVKVSFSDSYTGSASATFTINGVAPSASSNAVASGVRTYTLTPGATIAVGAVSIVVSGLTTPASQGNNSFTVTTSTGDYGGGFQYVGQANVVTVRAVVPTSLSFVIRDSADTANTNTCDMGTLTTSAVGTCSYRLKVGGNPTNGFTITVNTSGNFTNGTSDFNNANVGTGGAGGTALTAGTEGYGARITKGSITNGTTTLGTVYNAGATNFTSFVNTTGATLLTYSGPNNPSTSGDTTNTALVTHSAAISSNTSAGTYTQTVTYTVTPSF